MRCLRFACALVLGITLLNVCVAAAEIDPIVGEWRGEGMATLERLKIDADGRWDFLDKPGQPLKLKWERKDDGYILHISEKRGAHFATLAPDGVLSLTPMDAVHVPSAEARARSAIRFRRVGEGLGSLVKARQTPITASELVGHWEWVWSRTRLKYSLPQIDEMEFTSAGDIVVTNTLMRTGFTGRYTSNDGKLTMQLKGADPSPATNLARDGEWLALGSEDIPQTWPAEHLFARVEPGRPRVPAEVLGKWTNVEPRFEGATMELTFLPSGHFTLKLRRDQTNEERTLLDDHYYVRFWQSPHGPAMTRVVMNTEMDMPYMQMTLWKLEGDQLVLTSMSWDINEQCLIVAPESVRLKRVVKH